MENDKKYFRIYPRAMKLEYQYEKLVRQKRFKEAKILADELTELWVNWASSG